MVVYLLKDKIQDDAKQKKINHPINSWKFPKKNT